MTRKLDAAVAAGLLFALPMSVTGQSPWQVTPMARAVATFSHADPIPGGGSKSEFTITQPTAMFDIRYRDRWTLNGALSLESLTIGDGELTLGAWGEGFVDRRHPHTTVHELMAAGRDLLGQIDGEAQLGLAVGKGFVAFGTEDPMSRPFIRYPVNHHFAQLLERAVVTVQFAVGPIVVEGSLFNGDEPERPGQWPMIRLPDGTWRFGDSWSARMHLLPLAGIEVQASLAAVHSPEHREGSGGEARKSSLSARWQDAPSWGSRYALVEWARTSELEGFFVFHSFLAEAEVRRGRVAVGYRFERTERPEEERTVDLFRTKRPHIENSILGITRWSLHTVRAGFDVSGPGNSRLTPFGEVTFGSVREVGVGIVDVIGIYGRQTVRQLTAGVVLTWGKTNHRMGRYGVLAATAHGEH